MNLHPIEYAKAHPWATGVIVVIGGIVFIMFSGIFSGGGGSSNDGTVHRSDAEIAADAQIAAAQITAQGMAAQYGAAVTAAQIGAGVQLQSDQLNAQVAMRTVEAQEHLGLAQIDSDKSVGLATVGAQKDLGVAQINGQIQTQQIIATAQNKGKKHSATMGAISSIAGAAASIFGLFSDNRLKENPRLLGYTDDGLKIIEFNYLGSEQRYRGMSAQDVASKFPEAVQDDPATGYKRILPWKLPARSRRLVLSRAA